MKLDSKRWHKSRAVVGFAKAITVEMAQTGDFNLALICDADLRNYSQNPRMYDSFVGKVRNFKKHLGRNVI